MVAPSVASAGQVLVNNMSDVAVQMTAYDAATPAKVVGTWCVDTGAYDVHTLKVVPATLHADVTQVGCKEPVILNRTLALPPATQATTSAALYRLAGNKGKYTLTGPFAHPIEKE